MATYPIKVLLDRHRQPFIPFATTSSIVENGTNRRLDKMLGNLDDLQTNNKNSLVSAINEILTQHGGGGSSTGWQVVDKLPTENISATTIYLVPKEGAKKPNIYEEWVWVNEDWENIGTTEIDLSGYATTSMIGDLSTLQTTDKDCIVDAINEIVGTAGGTIANIGSLDDLTTEDKSSIVNAINEALTSGVDSATIKDSDMNITQDKLYISSDARTAVVNAINKNLDKPLLINILGTIYGMSLQFMVNISKPTNSTSSQSTVYGLINYKGIVYSWRAKMTIGKNGTKGIVTSVSFTTESLAQLSTVAHVNSITGDLTALNTEDKSSLVGAINELFTSTGTGGGSGSDFDPAKYLAIDNTTEYTPTDLYHPATKAYVDGLIASVPEPVDAYSKTEVDDKLADYLSKTNTESYTPTSDYHPATKKFVESVVASIPGPDLSGYYTKGEVDDAINSVSGAALPIYAVHTTKTYNQDNTSMSSADKAQVHAALADAREKGYNAIRLMLVTNTWGRIYTFDIPTRPGSGNSYYGLAPYNMNGTFFAKVALSFQAVDSTTYEATSIIFKVYESTEYILYKNNTASYTPTADYHPATKKYVDDSIGTIEPPEPDLSGYYTKEEVDNKIESIPTAGVTASTLSSRINNINSRLYYTVASNLDLSTSYTELNVLTGGYHGYTGDWNTVSNASSVAYRGYRGDTGTEHLVKMTAKYVATAPLRIDGLAMCAVRQSGDNTVYTLSNSQEIHTELGKYIDSVGTVSEEFNVYSIEKYINIDPYTISTITGASATMMVFCKKVLNLRAVSGTAKFKSIQVTFDRVYP